MSEEEKEKKLKEQINQAILNKFKNYFPNDFEIYDKYTWSIIYRNENRFVYEGTSKIDNKLNYIVWKEKIIDSESFKETLKELFFLIMLKNKKYFVNITDKKYIVDDENYKHLFMKFEGGYINLKQLYDYKYPNSKRMKDIIYQISFGLYILHFNNIVHNDINPTNILIDEDYKIKIADFSSAIYGDNNNINNISYSCTKAYAPPEFLNGNYHRNQKSDMWSLGVMIVELCLETQLFNNNDSIYQILKSILSLFDIQRDLDKETINSLIYNDNDQYNFNIERFKEKIKDSQKIDDDLIDLISHLLVLNPNKRYTAKEVIMSKYLKNYPGNDPIVLRKIETPINYELLINEMDEADFIKNLENLINISLK